MQRWFFLEDPNNEALRSGTRPDNNGIADHSTKQLIKTQQPYRKWLFSVQVPDLKKEEVVCVTGSCPELGLWQSEKAVPLEQEHTDSTTWSKVLEIPDNQTVEFRYCVCVIVESGIQVIVRSWETNLKPRIIQNDAKSPSNKDEPHIYGNYNDSERIDRGWLNKETVIQLKLGHNPLQLWRPKYVNRQIFVKVIPINIQRHNSVIPKSMSEALEESLSADTQDAIENPKHTITEVARLNSEDPTFQLQHQFGHQLAEDDMLIFQTTLLFPANIAFLIDFYIYSSRSEEGDPPYHAGFSYLLPSVLQHSEGSVVLPVTSTKQRPLGQIRVDYLVIGPLTNFKCDMSVSYARHWKKTRAALDVGHRGAGASFKPSIKNCAEVRENTIASLTNAIEHGADFVEFDVQLSKDLVPIIYHDFHVCIAMKKKKQLNDDDMLELPVKELTLDQLKLLKVIYIL